MTEYAEVYSTLQMVLINNKLTVVPLSPVFRGFQNTKTYNWMLPVEV